jgi:glycosyltransferase involved in cell wall biosynthesis
MSDRPIRLSVIMPAYNAAATIARAIESALNQTESDLEVIVVDDASTDATAAIALKKAAEDGRVRVLQQSVNRGAAFARNQAVAQARGQWVAPLDADDAFAPQRLRYLLKAAEECSADVVSDNLLLCPGQAQQAGVPMLSPGVLAAARWMSAAEFVAGNIGSRYTPRVSYGFLKPVIRSAFLNEHRIRYEERNRFGEDFLLSLSCLLNGARWWLMPEALYRYTVRPGSATDVQSSADLLRIRSREADVLRTHAMVRADPALARALRRHKRVIEHFYYYRAFTDALKARALRTALGILLERPDSLFHILAEGALQGPRVVLKALRGGYKAGLQGNLPGGSTAASVNSIHRA